MHAHSQTLYFACNSSRLRADILAVVVTALASFLVPVVVSIACESGAYVAEVKAADDVQHLLNEMNCTGERAFSVTWSGVHIITKRIEVSEGKNLSVTGANDGPNGIDAEGADGIFLVSNRSTLTLDNLRLRGGNSPGTGGAVAVDVSSIVNVTDCSFEGNTASISGDKSVIVFNQHRPSFLRVCQQAASPRRPKATSFIKFSLHVCVDFEQIRNCAPLAIGHT